MAHRSHSTKYLWCEYMSHEAVSECRAHGAGRSVSGVDLMLSHLYTKNMVIPEPGVGLKLQVAIKGPVGNLGE